ncbi:redoxin domain-containing protein [Chloroflexi bacterium TSY]|nr:redoxin domain-containing protein [Chloroflexi bacterium TSY]
MQILGISTDSVDKNAAFAKKYNFPFPLVSDLNRKICQAYDACDRDKAKRITYLVGPDGNVLQVFDDINPAEHTDKILSFLQEIPQSEPQTVATGSQHVSQSGVIERIVQPTNNLRRQILRNEQALTLDVESELDATNSITDGSPVSDNMVEPAIEMREMNIEDQPVSADEVSPSIVTASVDDSEIEPVESLIEPEDEPVIPDQVESVEPAPQPELQAPSFVYALGTIGYDFVRQIRIDGFAQAMANGNPDDPASWLAHLDENPQQAKEVVWTLDLDGIPIYAIRPVGTFAHVGYELIREFLAGQLNEGIQRVSVPGVIVGQMELLSGQNVPVLAPSLRGLYSWSTEALVDAIIGDASGDEADQVRGGVYNFLERIYHELRNLGVSSEERAINYAATNAFQATEVFSSAVNEGLELDQIEVEPSPIARPGGDAWDVKLTFFEPIRRLERARKVYRFSVDVSDVIPVTIGSMRAWSVYYSIVVF